MTTKNRIRKNGEEKLCTGFLHKENPTWLSISDFPVWKSAPPGLEWRLGKPMPECWECRRARLGQNPKNGWISKDEAWPIFARLISIKGSKQEACAALGKGPAFLSRRNERFRGEIVRQAEQLVYDLEKDSLRYHGRSEPEIIDPEPFGSILRKFYEDWQKEYPISEAAVHRPINEIFMGVNQYLCEKTGLTPKRLYDFRHNRIPRIPFSDADKVLQAMNLTHLMYDGDPPTIQIKPNPLWSLKNYLEYMRRNGVC